MPLNRNVLESLIRERKIQDIFTERLGWDYAAGDDISLSVTFANENYSIAARPVAEKRGFVICRADCDDIPPRAVRKKLQNQLSKHHYEHLLVLCCQDGQQIWMVTVERENKPPRTVEASYKEGQSPDLLLQKLNGMVFSIDEEDDLNITVVVGRVKQQFSQNADKVTRKFYRRFREELTGFQEFIKGISGQVDQQQYAALMLNRLMFIYFIQSKGFLNRDPRYLQNCLERHQRSAGSDSFYHSFYRHFLMALFHRGLGKPEALRDRKVRELIGSVPYLNGGLFDTHKLEQQYHEDMDIDDKAFENLFKFFDQYRWHLDDSDTASGKDINPDVIGYIFEKYINDRAQLGAYYTQEDITGYIAQNTILPHLLRCAHRDCREAFDHRTGTFWRLLRENPDHYIYDAVSHGADKADSNLPEDIAIGLDAKSPDLLQRRAQWNCTADPSWGLPTETWREALNRRAHYQELRKRIVNGELTDIADLTTENLDIARLVRDFLQQHEGSDLISAFYMAIAGRQPIKGRNIKPRRGITILDPACGSGAFLFAALNVLEPLYTACIERMQEFVDQDDKLHDGQGKKHAFFRQVLDEIKNHAVPEYWIYRSIILNNLFGVDIMPEAVEVAKLRLFLKLAAVAEVDRNKPNLGLEPLPDIDFNIRAGNSLVGFVNRQDLEQQVQRSHQQQEMELATGLSELLEEAEKTGKAYKHFVDTQIVSDIEHQSFKESKRDLQEQMQELNRQLDDYLRQAYGKQEPSSEDFKVWKKSHQPFHWFAEFYGIIEDGGFDIIIGNPPYVEYSKVKKDYCVQNYKSIGNIYAMFIERSTSLGKSDMGMIVPISLPSTPRMSVAREILLSRGGRLIISNFADRPGCLFRGVHQKLSIFISSVKNGNGLYCTDFIHLNSEERSHIFKTISYCKCDIDNSKEIWPKIGTTVAMSINRKIKNSAPGIDFHMIKHSRGGYPVFLNKRMNFYVKCFLSDKESDEYKTFHANSEERRRALMAILNSSLFFWNWEVISDCWDLTKRELAEFPVDFDNFSPSIANELAKLGIQLEDDLESKKEYVGTAQTEYEYKHKKSKDIIDTIDIILADAYGLSQLQLDYIINYSIKYRLGGLNK